MLHYTFMREVVLRLSIVIKVAYSSHYLVSEYKLKVPQGNYKKGTKSKVL